MIKEVKEPAYPWHISLHQRVSHERLVFVWLTFKGLYNAKIAPEQIRNALRAADVNSYAIWELLGERDVLIKAFIPAEKPKATLRKHLQENIKAPHRVTIEIFSVDTTLRHWMWKRTPQLQDFFLTVDRSHMSDLNSEHSVPEIDIKKYKDKGFIVPIVPRDEMKFFSRIPEPEAGVVISEDQVESDLGGLLEKAERSRYLKGLALYKGDGDHTKDITFSLAHPSSLSDNMSSEPKTNNRDTNVS